MNKNDWVAEPEAAKMVGRAPRTLRRYSKSGIFPLTYTSLNGRGYMYSLRSIEQLLNNNSSRTSKQ